MGVCHSTPMNFDDASDGAGYEGDGAKNRRKSPEKRIQVSEKRSVDGSASSSSSTPGTAGPGMSPTNSSAPAISIQHRTHDNTKSASQSRLMLASSSTSPVAVGAPQFYRQVSNPQQQQQQQKSLNLQQHPTTSITTKQSQVGKGMTSGEPDHSDPGAASVNHNNFSYSEASITQSPGEGYTYSLSRPTTTTDSAGSLTAVEGGTQSTGANSGSQAQYSHLRLMYATLPFQVDTAHDEYFDAEERANLMSSHEFRSGDSAIDENRESLAQQGASQGMAEIEMCNIEWKKGQLLGAGSYGQVYLGLDAARGGLLAVKQVPLNQSVQTEQRLRQLEREIGILRRLQHPAIVAYKGVRVEEGNINIFLEYVPGGSIASLLQRFGKFNETLVRLYTKQILEGLKYLHQHQIVHRDIKGGNILVDINGQCKLADFGASLSLAEMAKEKPTIQGTPYWMAPEVIKQEGHGRKVDIWSVGCTVIEMISGRHPWKRFDTQAAALFHIARATEPPEIPAELSSDGRDFVEWCLKRDPRERPNVLKLLEHPFITGGKDKVIKASRAPLTATPSTCDMKQSGMKTATADRPPLEAAPPGFEFEENEVGEGQPHPGVADERAIVAFLADCHAKMMANVSFEFRSSVRSLGSHLYN